MEYSFFLRGSEIGMVSCFLAPWTESYNLSSPLPLFPSILHPSHRQWAGHVIWVLWEIFFLLWECGGLNENVSHGLMYLSTWSPVGGTVWKGVGVVLLEEAVYPGGWTLRSHPFPVFSPCFRLKVQDVSPQHSAPVAMLACCDGCGLLGVWNCKPKHTTSLSCLGHGILSQQQKSN